MKVISLIEQPEVIKKILKHLGLWEVKARPPPKTSAPQPNGRIDISDSQVTPCDDHLYCDPDGNKLHFGLIRTYLYVKSSGVFKNHEAYASIGYSGSQ